MYQSDDPDEYLWNIFMSTKSARTSWFVFRQRGGFYLNGGNVCFRFEESYFNKLNNEMVQHSKNLGGLSV